MIKVKFQGQIVSGSDEYKYVGIQENFDLNGELSGLNVLMSGSSNFDIGHDDWVSDYPSLIDYLSRRGWVIKWISKT